MFTILITGGSGLIGRRLTAALLARGHRVHHLGRGNHAEGNIKSFTWNIDEQYIQPGAFQDVDGIVHLAGAGIADKPWSEDRKKEILESRTKSTRLLFQELKKINHNVRTFVCASAIGYYGIEHDEELCTEDSAPGNDFLALVVRHWEKEAEAFETLGIRVATLRTGIVLSEKGGALEELVKPVRYYIGAPLGTGNQYMSWIHLDDHCAIIIKAIEDQALQGHFNSVAPYPVTNRDFTTAIAHVLHKPLILPPVPAFVLKFLLGEMSSLVLRGANVSAAKILNAGYVFQYPRVNEALTNLLIKSGIN